MYEWSGIRIFNDVSLLFSIFSLSLAFFRDRDATQDAVSQYLARTTSQ